MVTDTELRGEHVERLQRLGLPPAAAKAYLALINLGETEARDVARLSGIPLAKVYSALDQLHGRGLANVFLDTPRRYSPRPVGDYLQTLRKAQEERLKELDAEATQLSEILSVRPEPTDDDRGSFSLLRGRASSIRRISSVLQRAQHDVLILATAGFHGRAHFGAQVLAAARARGVKIRILCQDLDGDCEALAAKLPAAEIRRAPLREEARHVAMMVIDGATALIVHFIPDDHDLRRGHDVGMVTTENAIVSSISELIARQWDASEPVRLLAPHPLELPAEDA